MSKIRCIHNETNSEIFLVPVLANDPAYMRSMNLRKEPAPSSDPEDHLSEEEKKLLKIESGAPDESLKGGPSNEKKEKLEDPDDKKIDELEEEFKAPDPDADIDEEKKEIIEGDAPDGKDDDFVIEINDQDASDEIEGDLEAINSSNQNDQIKELKKDSGKHSSGSGEKAHQRKVSSHVQDKSKK